ncbi:conserved exported hypothetical protein [Candidatus Desulfarcum epimagneticum]|uniref:Uncharacterized protein n=1 Tax=uncultured Desulfobacteraceae bacterium TaxID=218296 RepID=A0A484HHJ9_9BACT|nr:conserved exported hypothetical protein [uncultured Desulfobacteraceae bacterium]
MTRHAPALLLCLALAAAGMGFFQKATGAETGAGVMESREIENDLGDDFADEPQDDPGDDLTDGAAGDDLGDDFTDGDDAGDLEGDFDDAQTAPPPAPEKKTARGWRGIPGLSGRLKFSSSYHFSQSRPAAGQNDWRGVSAFKLKAFLEFDRDIFDSRFGPWKAKVSGEGFYDGIYAARGRDEYAGHALETRERGAEIREAYVQGSLSRRLDVKAGRQIAVWGKSDYIRVTDVLNPVNMREPGKTDLEDLRLPALMSRLDFYAGNWSFSGIALHERRLNQEPAFGSAFYPYAFAPPPEKTASHTLTNTEWALSAGGSFSGKDGAVYYADCYDKNPHLVISSAGAFEKRHARVKMIGADFNAAKGSWLFKTEAAFFDGLRFSDRMAAGSVLTLSDRGRSRADILAGAEYSGFTDATVSLETVHRHLIDYDSRLAAGGEKRNRLQTVLNVSRSFLNERLSASFFASVYGERGQDGALFRARGEYEITDSVSASGGVLFYESGDLFFFQKIGGNDQVFVDLEWRF